MVHFLNPKLFGIPEDFENYSIKSACLLFKRVIINWAFFLLIHSVLWIFSDILARPLQTQIHANTFYFASYKKIIMHTLSQHFNLYKIIRYIIGFHMPLAITCFFLYRLRFQCIITRAKNIGNGIRIIIVCDHYDHALLLLGAHRCSFVETCSI